MEPRLLTLKQLAEYLGLAPEVVADQVSRREFPVPPISLDGEQRWDRRAVDRWIARAHRQGAGPHQRLWEALPVSCQEVARRRLAVVEEARRRVSLCAGTKTRQIELLATLQGIAPNTLRNWLAAADRALQAAKGSGADPTAAQLRALAPEYGKNTSRTGQRCCRQSRHRN